MISQCLSKGIKIDFPKNFSGVDYLINELKSKYKVIYQQYGISITFSAKGLQRSSILLKLPLEDSKSYCIKFELF